MGTYYVETGQGCGLRSARDAESARRGALREVGTDAGVGVVRKATKRDISWVRGMGGLVPGDGEGDTE